MTSSKWTGHFRLSVTMALCQFPPIADVRRGTRAGGPPSRCVTSRYATTSQPERRRNRGPSEIQGRTYALRIIAPARKSRACNVLEAGQGARDSTGELP